MPVYAGVSRAVGAAAGQASQRSECEMVEQSTRELRLRRLLPRRLRRQLGPLRRSVTASRHTLHPLHIMRGIGLTLLRASSTEFRAYTDVFLPEFERKAEWRSGLRDSHYLLYAITRALHPRIIVEIGSARGKS